MDNNFLFVYTIKLSYWIIVDPPILAGKKILPKWKNKLSLHVKVTYAILSNLPIWGLKCFGGRYCPQKSPLVIFPLLAVLTASPPVLSVGAASGKWVHHHRLFLLNNVFGQWQANLQLTCNLVLLRWLSLSGSLFSLLHRQNPFGLCDFMLHGTFLSLKFTELIAYPARCRSASYSFPMHCTWTLPG